MFERLFREPQGGKPYQIMAFIGLFAFLAGVSVFLFFSVEQDLRFIALGQAAGSFGLALSATAELLPRNRTGAAGLLRLLAFTILALSAGVVIAGLWMMLG